MCSGAQLLEQRCSGVVDEQLAVPDVSSEHGVPRVASLRPDLEGRYARLDGAGREAGARAMAGDAGGVYAGGDNALLDDERCSLPEPLRGDTAMPVDGAKDGPGFDPETASQRSKARARQWRVRPKGAPTFLRPAPSWSVLERLSVTISPCRTRPTSAQFNPTISDRQSRQRSRSGVVPGHACPSRPRHLVQDLEQVLSQRRLGLTPSGPPPALDPPQGGANDFRPATIGQPPRLLRLGDGRDAADELGDTKDLSMRREASADSAPLQAAKWGEVGPVGSTCALRDAGLDQGSDLVGNGVGRRLIHDLSLPALVKEALRAVERCIFKS
jgi:hypothetical protein